MRVVLQRVSKASVTVNNKLISSIEKGYLLLVGVCHEDTKEDADWLVKKIVNLRVFADEEGAMNLNILQVEGELLVVSQFTLFGSVKKGNRPSFVRSARPEVALPLYQYFISALSKLVVKPIKQGEFGAMMDVALVNDGPVTLQIDSKNRE